jgi:regulator of sigma E protease
MPTVLAILALSALIIVHEGGHYFVARWSGMRVERFSLGFGPAIVKWRHAGTQFQIAPIFFGGFVHIVGMNPHEEYDDKDPSVYPNRPTILRFLTILAGPLTNMVFATVLIFSVYAIAGLDVPHITSIAQGMPAEGRLQPGDEITAVDGEPVDVLNFSPRVQAAQGRSLHLTVMRGGQPVAIDVAPQKSDGGAWRIGVGIGSGTIRNPISLGRAVLISFRYPVLKSEQILVGLWDVVTGAVPAEAVSVVGMTGIIAEQIHAGWIATFEFLAMLNVYLCLINLLPLPALDGGRLVFLGYELATRRRPNPKVEAAVHMAGFVVLLIVMVLVTFKDIKNLFS